MKKIFFILVLLVFMGMPQQGFAKLNAPNPLPVSSIGERSARLEWTWSPPSPICGNNTCEEGEERLEITACLSDCAFGEAGILLPTITDFEVDIARKGSVSDCRDIESWGVPNLVGTGERRFTARGLERGKTYCFKIMARADNPVDNSEFAYGLQFTTKIGGGGAVCGNNRCETGEDPISCPQDCNPGGGGGGGGGGFIPGNLNPISSQTLPQLLENVLNFLFGLSMVILPIIILYGGILLLTAGGDPQKISKSRTILLWAVIAFAIILLARGLPPVLRGLL